jgi:O-antigen/teichoic acid export membrane protein
VTPSAEKLVGSVERKGPHPKFSDAATLTGSQAAKWSSRLVFVIVVARALGPEKFGVYALLFAVTEFLASASGTGYTDYLTRETAREERLGWGLAAQLVLLRIAIAIPVAAMEVGILSLMHYPRVILADTVWMALTLIPRSLSEAVQGVLRGIRQYQGYLAIELFFGGSLVAGAVLLFLRHGEVGLAIAAEIFAACAASLAAVMLAVKFKTSERFWLSGSHLLKKSAVFNAYSFVGSLYDRFDVVLLSKLAGDYSTGIYSVAYRALNMTQIVGYGVLYSLLPQLSRDAGSNVERRRLEKAMRMLLSTAFVVVLVTIVFAGPMVLIVLGPRYAEAASVLRILIWAVILRYLNCALNIALLAMGRERVFVMTSLICLGVNLIGNLALIPLYGWRAAATLTIVTELVLFAQNLYWTGRAPNAVGLTWGMARTSLAFVVFLVATLAAGYCGWQLAVGSASLIAFVAHLYRSGVVSEFRTVWGTEY